MPGMPISPSIRVLMAMLPVSRSGTQLTGREAEIGYSQRCACGRRFLSSVILPAVAPFLDGGEVRG